MAEQIFYVYGIAPAALDDAGAQPPPGLDGAAVQVIREGEIGALCSRLDPHSYERDRIESLLADIAWIGPKATAHDSVVTWASDKGPMIPLPMFTLYSDSKSVRAMLRERGEELRRKLARVSRGQEFGLRVFRIDEVLLARLGELSPRLGELERAARAASPGQRYLLERKAETERKTESRRLSAQIGRDTFAALSARSIGAVQEPVPSREPTDVAGVAVLNAFFLVQREGLESFQAELTELARLHESKGFRFQFTGPWPPYHFVGNDS